MLIRADKLRDTLKLLEPVVPRKTTLPVLGYILLSNGRAIATDLETAIAVDLPEATEDILLPAKKVSDCLKYVAGYAVLTVERKNGEVNLSWDGGRASYPADKPEDFPPLVSPTARVSGDLDGDILVKELSTLLPYAATEESRPVLTGVCLRLGETSSVGAADGFRLAYDAVPFTFPSKEEVILAPGTVRMLANLWKLAPGPPVPSNDIADVAVAKRNINFSIAEKNDTISFRFGKISVMAKVIVGNFPQYEQLVPTPTNKVTFMGPDLEQAVRRVRNIAKASSGIVRLQWTETEMTVFASDAESGKIEAKIPVNGQDGPGKIGLSWSYLVGYLSGKEGVVTLGVTNTSSPALFTYRNSPNVVLMPMMVQWE